jgi:hypothetical protein
MLEIGRKRVGISISDNISEISEPAWREGESGEEETKNTRSEPEIANQRKRNGEARGQKRSLTETRKSTQPAERAAHVRGQEKEKTSGVGQCVRESNQRKGQRKRRRHRASNDHGTSRDGRARLREEDRAQAFQRTCGRWGAKPRTSRKSRPRGETCVWRDCLSNAHRKRGRRGGRAQGTAEVAQVVARSSRAAYSGAIGRGIRVAMAARGELERDGEGDTNDCACHFAAGRGVCAAT